MRTRTRNSTFIAVALVAVLANGLLGLVQVRSVLRAEQRVAHTREVEGSLHALLSNLQEAETGQRGYLLTGDRAFLAPYERAVGAHDARVLRPAVLTRDNPEQQRRLAALVPIVEAEFEALRRGVALRASPDFDASRALPSLVEGKRSMDEIRARVDELVATERSLAEERGRASARALKTAQVAGATGLFASVALVAAVMVLLRRRLHDRRHAADSLEAESRRLRTTLTSIGDAVVVTDVEGRVVIANEPAKALMGVGEEIVGRPLDDVFHVVNEETRAPVESPVRNVLRAGSVVSLANRTALLGSGGEWIPIGDSGAPIRHRDGSVEGVVLVFRDMREERRSQRAAQEASAR